MAEFKKNDKVALAEDINCRGIITLVTVAGGYMKDDPAFYTVQWEKSGSYQYLASALIGAKEADERAAKLGGEKKSLIGKFKDMVKGKKDATT